MISRQLYPTCTSVLSCNTLRHTRPFPIQYRDRGEVHTLTHNPLTFISLYRCINHEEEDRPNEKKNSIITQSRHCSLVPPIGIWTYFTKPRKPPQAVVRARRFLWTNLDRGRERGRAVLNQNRSTVRDVKDSHVSG